MNAPPDLIALVASSCTSTDLGALHQQTQHARRRYRGQEGQGGVLTGNWCIPEPIEAEWQHAGTYFAPSLMGDNDDCNGVCAHGRADFAAKRADASAERSTFGAKNSMGAEATSEHWLIRLQLGIARRIV